MKYNVHAGHNAAGLIACGAVSLLDESKENRLVTKEIIRLLKLDKHTVYDCTVDNAKNVSDNLYKIVEKCNAHSVDLDISIHFNSGASDKKGNGKTTGCEVWVTETSGIKGTVSNKICKNLEELGFKNRGTKTSSNLYVLNRTKAKAILVEVCFVDDKDDYNLYKKIGYKKVARAIAEGIVGHKIDDEVNSYKTMMDMNFRKSATTESTVIGRIPKGTILSGTPVENSWLKTKYENKTGYVKIKGETVTYCKKI